MPHIANFNIHFLLKPALLFLMLIAHPDARAQRQRAIEDNGIRFLVTGSGQRMYRYRTDSPRDKNGISLTVKAVIHLA